MLLKLPDLVTLSDSFAVVQVGGHQVRYQYWAYDSLRVELE